MHRNNNQFRQIMKPLTILLTGTLLLSSFTSEARILRVNYVQSLATSCSDCYTSLQTALNAANGYPGTDTIHLEPSNFSYGDGTISSPVVIIGNGFYLTGVNSNPEKQANGQTSTVNLLTLNTGASGSTFTGLRIAGTGGGITMTNTSNITINRNFFDGVGISWAADGNTCSNITVAENIFSGSGLSQTATAQTISGLLIRNNYFSGRLDLGDTNDNFTGLVITNNTFNYNGTHLVRDAEIAYNAFNLGNVSDANNNIQNNISASALPAGTDNQVVNMVTVFSATGSIDGRWDILDASPYDENGASPRGMYSGISPYKLSGIPAVPSIYFLQSSLNTTPNGTVNVTLSTRSNN